MAPEASEDHFVPSRTCYAFFVEEQHATEVFLVGFVHRVIFVSAWWSRRAKLGDELAV